MSRARRSPGLIRSLRDAFNFHAMPALESFGFVADPAFAAPGGWDGEGYDWHLIARPRPNHIIRLRLSTGRSRAPALDACWSAFRMDEDGRPLAEAALVLARKIAKTGDSFLEAGSYDLRPVAPIGLSPWRKWTELGLGFGQGYEVPRNRALRVVAGIPVWLVMLVLAALFLPLNIIAIVGDQYWMKSEKARSGRRQEVVARRFGERLRNAIPKRMPKLLAEPINVA